MAHSIKVFPDENRVTVNHESRGQITFDLKDTPLARTRFGGARVESYVPGTGRVRFYSDSKEFKAKTWRKADSWLNDIDSIFDDRDNQEAERERLNSRPSEDHHWVNDEWQLPPVGKKFDADTSQFVDLDLEELRRYKMADLDVGLQKITAEYIHSDGCTFDASDLTRFKLRDYLEYADSVDQSNVFWTVCKPDGIKERVPMLRQELRGIYEAITKHVMTCREKYAAAKQDMRTATTAKEISTITIET